MEMSEHVKKWVRPHPDTLNSSENQNEIQVSTMLQISSITSSQRYEAVGKQAIVKARDGGG